MHQQEKCDKNYGYWFSFTLAQKCSLMFAIYDKLQTALPVFFLSAVSTAVFISPFVGCGSPGRAGGEIQENGRDIFTGLKGFCTFSEVENGGHESRDQIHVTGN